MTLRNICCMAAAGFMLAACLDGSSAGEAMILETDKDFVYAPAESADETALNRQVIRIRSNRSWYAHLDNVVNPVGLSGQVEWGTIDVCEHFNLTGTAHETDITVTFETNFSTTPVKGVLNLYSEGQLFKSIPVIQAGADPYLRLEEPADTQLSPDEEGRLVFTTNCAWTAEAVEDGLTGIELSRTSGEAGEGQEITFTYTNSGCDPAVLSEGLIRIVPQVEGLEPLEVTYTQRPFMTIDFSSDIYTPSLPAKTSAEVTSHRFMCGENEYEISVRLINFKDSYIVYKTKVGSNRGFVAFPGIEGCTLKTVEIFLKGDDKEYKIKARMENMDDDNRIVLSDSYDFTEQGVDDHFVLNLGEGGKDVNGQPQPGEVYRFIGLGNRVCHLSKFILHYE